MGQGDDGGDPRRAGSELKAVNLRFALHARRLLAEAVALRDQLHRGGLF